jgi:predicted ATPase/DNA-binding CsgD family transcriptional regulator
VTTPNNLPAEVSSFVGREQPLADLRKLLHKSRLVTLTGPGGAGKTRLALRVAGEVLDRYPNGVWLIDLAPVTDARLLEQTVASACGIRESRRRALIEVLAKTLASSQVLLILDGCEHLVDQCAALVSRLQRACPRLSVVITSREPLGLPGEVIWRVPSLTVPGVGDGQRPELLLQSEAVRLFIERARLSRPALELDSSNSPAVAQICVRLEGIPLAIELAAGLARVLTFEDILVRLHDRFRLLTGGSRTALPRHQTLRAAVDWSFGLLSDEERALLVRLSVFAGGFDLAAAEATAAGESLDPSLVLTLLSRLVDKSLVVAEEGGAQRTRYRMLDTIREYAREKLASTDEADIRRRHSRYFVQWCGGAHDGLRSRNQVQWLERLDEEQGNIRLAIEWSLAEAPEDALRIVGAMDRYWSMRGHLAEAIDWLDRALETDSPGAEPMAAALLSRAHVRWLQGDYEAAHLDARACIDRCREMGPSQTLFVAVTLLAIVHTGAGDWQSAGRLHDEAFQMAWQLKDPWWVASSLNNLGLIALERGDHEVARGRLEQALTGFRQAGDRFSLSMSLDSLARVNMKLGDPIAARSNYLEALTVAAEFQDTVNVANLLDGLAQLEAMQGKFERVVSLAAAAERMRKTVGTELAPEWKEPLQVAVGGARAKLGREASDAAARHGASMGAEEALRFAMGAPTAAAKANGSPLTARERQVALLIAEGLTNGEIASRLKMASRTADAHVEHIRNKLGLRTRSQIAVWTHETLGMGNT